MLLMFDITGEPTGDREEAAYVYASSDEAAREFESHHDHYTINGEGYHRYAGGRYERIDNIEEFVRVFREVERKLCRQ